MELLLRRSVGTEVAYEVDEDCHLDLVGVFGSRYVPHVQCVVLGDVSIEDDLEIFRAAPKRLAALVELLTGLPVLEFDGVTIRGPDNFGIRLDREVFASRGRTDVNGRELTCRT
jgi:hypothetical protein